MWFAAKRNIVPLAQHEQVHACDANKVHGRKETIGLSLKHIYWKKERISR